MRKKLDLGVKRRVFIASCASLASGCIGLDSGRDIAGQISAKPINESELNDSTKVWDYNDSEIAEYEDTRRAIRDSYNESIENGEPWAVSHYDVPEHEIPSIKKKSNSTRGGIDVIYVRYRGRIFRVIVGVQN